MCPYYCIMLLQHKPIVYVGMNYLWLALACYQDSIILWTLDVTILIKLLKLAFMMEVGSGSTQQCTLLT